MKYALLQDFGFALRQQFVGKKRLARLAYLSDMFDNLNGQRFSLQGPNASGLKFFDKVSSSMKKTIVWKSLCGSGSMEVFVSVSEYRGDDCTLEDVGHLTNSEDNFKIRFPELEQLQQFEWMRHPFAVTVGEKISHVSVKAREAVMERSSDTSLKIEFEALSFPEFWFYIKTHGTLRSSHRGVTASGNGVFMWGKISSGSS
jgi:hypothetical protein